jgi:lipopolysaccharide export system permease protein
MNILDRYIVREHVGPFFISISLIMFLFTLNLALRILGRIVGQGLEFMVIIEFFFLNLAWILTLAVPMSVLVACLMGFGRLAGDREIVALKASGMGIVRMIRPVLIMGLLVSTFAFFFQDQILPDMNHRNRLLSSSIRRKKPNVVLREGSFTRELPKLTLLVKDISDETGKLSDITIFDESNANQPSTIISETGRLSYVDSLGMYNFKLFDGEIHQLKRTEKSDYDILKFKEALFRIDSPDQQLHRREKGYRGDRELDLAGLKERISELQNRKTPERYERQINRYRVEYHKKFAISAAAIVFVLIGAPLGIKLTHGGLGVSGPLAIFFFLLYWTFLIGGEDVADRGIIVPWLAMWLPNIILSILGMFLIRHEMRSHSAFQLPWQRKKLSEDVDRGQWSKISNDEVRRLAQIETEKYKSLHSDNKLGIEDIEMEEKDATD